MPRSRQKLRLQKHHRPKRHRRLTIHHLPLKRILHRRAARHLHSARFQQGENKRHPRLLRFSRLCHRSPNHHGPPQSEDGVLGTRAKDPTSQRIPIYFSQGDLLCPTEHPIPRMSQGTFRIALEAIYKAVTGAELERVVYGKPELATYKYADEIMTSWMETIHNEERLPKNIYMIGDNPQSDIIGGNMYGWNTCLVRTGVYQGEGNDKQNPASFGVFGNVLEAVKSAVRKELGEEFRFEWSESMNPVTGDHSLSAVE